MKKTVIVVMLLLLTGCIPLKQYESTGGIGYDNFHYEDGDGLLTIGPNNRKKAITLIAEKSYAISPNGKRYSIHSQPYPYDLEPSHLNSLNPYVRDQIILIDSHGRIVRGKLSNGTWLFHFEILTQKGKESRDFKIRNWIYYYNPIWSGLPL